MSCRSSPSSRSRGLSDRVAGVGIACRWRPHSSPMAALWWRDRLAGWRLSTRCCLPRFSDRSSGRPSKLTSPGVRLSRRNPGSGRSTGRDCGRRHWPAGRLIPMAPNWESRVAFSGATHRPRARAAQAAAAAQARPLHAGPVSGRPQGSADRWATRLSVDRGPPRPLLRLLRSRGDFVPISPRQTPTAGVPSLYVAST